MRATADRLAVEQLLEAYKISDRCNEFFACPGSNGNRIIGMATCRTCGILPEER